MMLWEINDIGDKLERRKQSGRTVDVVISGNMLFLLFCAILGVCLTYTTDVLPNDKFCFKDHFDVGSKISGGFHVVKGGNMLINFQIHDVNGGELYNYEDKAEGSYGFTATQTGDYDFCVINNYNVRKTVAFQYSEKTVAAQNDRSEDKNSALYNTINQIGSAVEFISKKQRFVLEKDARTMHTVKKTADKTGTWCLIELIAIGVIATVQIAFIFKVVQRKRVIGV